jgi:RimJ/RimL family protein N-acetyltransferase
MTTVRNASISSHAGVAVAAALMSAVGTWGSLRGDRITIRAVRPQDADRLQAYIRGLSSEARRNRFLGAVSELAPARLKHLTQMDRPGEMTLLACAETREEPQMIAEAVLVKAPNSQRCEIALSVADAWQRKGVGTLLLRNLECRASMLGADFLFGDVLRTNTAMKCLARRAGFSIQTPFTDARLVEIAKDLSIRQSGSPCMAGKMPQGQTSAAGAVCPM